METENGSYPIPNNIIRNKLIHSVNGNKQYFEKDFLLKSSLACFVFYNCYHIRIHINYKKKITSSSKISTSNIALNFNRLWGNKGKPLAYLKVWRACWQNHFVGFAGLTVAGKSDICERFFIPQMFEGWNHVRLEIIPAETKLLLIALSHFYVFWPLQVWK